MNLNRLFSVSLLLSILVFSIFPLLYCSDEMTCSADRKEVTFGDQMPALPMRAMGRLVEKEQAPANSLEKLKLIKISNLMLGSWLKNIY